MEYIDLKHISKVYNTNGIEKIPLNDINLCIEQGEMLCIMGASGSGKSTLLKIIGCIDTQYTVEIIFKGQSMKNFTTADYDKYRQHSIGYIFQDFNLLDGLTLKENIILPLTLINFDSEQIDRKYNEVMRYIDLTYCENNYPEKSSGGEQQRAAICRALIKSPKVILADEPTGSLDNENTKAILTCLQNINKNSNTTMVIVTHDEVVASYCSSVVFIENGQIYKRLENNGDAQSFYNLIITESSKIRGIL